MEEKPLFQKDKNYIEVNILKGLVDNWLQRESGYEEVEKLVDEGGEKWIEKGLNTSLKNGIKSSTIEEREEVYGSNKMPKLELKSYWEHCWEALEDLLLRILIVAGIADIVIQAIKHDEEDKYIFWLEGFAIILTVTLVVNITAYINYKKERQFSILNEESEASKKITIIRNGTILEDIRMDQVFVGDLVIIKPGMEIAGDGLVIEAYSLLLDESSMTGETKPMIKETIENCENKKNKLLKEKGLGHLGLHDVPSPIILSGTRVKNGNGKMIVINVGNNSAIGKIKEIMTSGEEGLTPLQMKLENIAQKIGYFGLFSALLIIVVLSIRYIIEMSTGSIDNWSSHPVTYHLMQFLNFLLIGIAILIIAIPEGLPMAVTLSLAFSVKQMMKDNNLVRKMAACETMGGANIICSDKTGTLTRNEMYLTHFWNTSEFQVFNPEKNEPLPLTNLAKEDAISTFLDTIIYNSLENPQNKNGNPTELAILRYIDLCGYNIVEYREKLKKVFNAPFSSDRKRMSTIVKMEDNTYYVFIKGASEYILKSCNKILSFQNGNDLPLDSQISDSAEKAIDQMARRALRTIGLAFKKLGSDFNESSPDEHGIYEFEKDGFTLVGICGIKDIIRAEVPMSVKKCHRAGINVKMVTGDNKITARAIAREVNIINEDNDQKALVMEGPEFLRQIGGVICDNCRDKENCDCLKNEKEQELPGNSNKKIRIDTIKNQDAFDKIWKNLAVLARSRPEDKYALVIGLKERGNVVAVTGDGTNDAPALSKADVGFAMGIAGTEVAKEAASIIILDDNFTSIVLAARWGRNIYDSIKKFLMFQLTVNVVSVITTLISAAITKEPIFSTVQMLWINIIMDTLAALALATEPPTDALLERLPHKRNDFIITPIMLKKILGQAVYQIAVLMIFFFLGDKFLIDIVGQRQLQPGTNLIVDGRISNGYDKHNYDNQYSLYFTYSFNVFVMMTFFNFINARILDNKLNIFKNITKSKLLLIILAIIFVLQVIFLTFAGPLIKVTMFGLDIVGWLITIAFGLFGLVWGVLISLLPIEKLFGGLGSQEVKPEKLDLPNSISIRRSHTNAYFKRNSVFRQKSMIVEPNA